MAQSRREVEIAVKARAAYGSVLRKATKDFQGSAAAQAKTQARRDHLAQQKAEIEAPAASYKTASDSAQRYAQQMRATAQADNLSAAEQRELRDAFALSRDRARELKQALNEKRQAYSALTQGQGRTYAAHIRQIEAKALRKLKHPSRSRKLRSFLDQ